VAMWVMRRPVLVLIPSLAVLVLAGPVEGQHVGDISANAVYWYFVALSWVALYTIVFLTPRFL